MSELVGGQNGLSLKWFEFQQLLHSAIEQFSSLRDSESSISATASWEKAYHKAFKVRETKRDVVSGRT